MHYNILGKVRRIKFTSGKVITYLYDAGGNKLKMKTWQGTTLQNTTDYVGGFVYENGALSFFGSPEGRVIKNGSSFEYQYAIADHQGNTRVVFSGNTPTPQSSTANMEAASNSEFYGYPSGAYRSSMPLFNHTPGGTYSQLLRGNSASQVGVAKSYKVYPGDKVKIEAWGKYQNPTSTGSNLAGFASALLSAFGVPAPGGGETGTVSAALETWGSLVASGNGGTSSGPKAFVNIIVFDKNYNFLDAAWEAIDPAAQQVGATPVVAHDYMMREYNVKEEGYVFMYISNENPTLVDVYFDDVVMTHTPTNVIQYNEYYPFGLQTANSWTREGVTGNRYLYNAANELNATTGWYEMFFRDYDPVLGRMLQVDPYASSFASMTPYNYAGNSPLVMNDPSGGVMSPYKREMINDYNTQAYELGMSNAGFLSEHGQSVSPGSGNHWSDSYSNSYRDYFLMSVGNFENKYGISIGEFRENLLGVSTSDPVLINLALRGYDISKPIWVDETTYKYLGTAGNEHRFRKTENSYLITSGVSAGPGLENVVNWLDQHWYVEVKYNVTYGAQATIIPTPNGPVPFPYVRGAFGVKVNLGNMVLTERMYARGDVSERHGLGEKGYQGIGVSVLGWFLEFERDLGPKGGDSSIKGGFGSFGFDANLSRREVFIGIMPSISAALGLGAELSGKLGVRFNY